MKFTDCFWEKKNLGEEVVEITVERDDVLKEGFCDMYINKDYLVIKVPINKPDFNFFLGEKGFSLIELQMEMSTTIKNFNFNHKLIKWIEPQVDFNKVNDDNTLDEVLSNIDSRMFTTDRISIDSHYGPEVGCQRYKNWIHDEFVKGTVIILQIFYCGKHIGFLMYREAEITRGLLGGIYSNYQNLGLGLLTPSALPLYIIKNNIQVKKIVADISSNNKPVWDLYATFGYNISNSNYVFIKHNKK